MTAQGYYGTLSWTYDANGNRASETRNGVTSAYAYPATSNRLSSVTPSGQTGRSFTYDASGDILTDSRTGALGMSFEYDVEGRLSKAYQTNAPSQGAVYAYDAMNRLASRTATSGSTTTTTLYVHDINDHIIAETNASGQTLREYIWLNDLPVAIIDGVNTASPVIYYVHTDHLGRPARLVLAQYWHWAWDVAYGPFGEVAGVWADPGVTQDMRFPGQWFQMESGLAYNWHRHYDASLGRYVQPDPIGYAGGRSLFAYAEANPLSVIDPDGLSGITAIGGICLRFPALCVAIPTGISSWMASRPPNMSRLEERWWDRICRDLEDPCPRLKEAAAREIDGAKAKIDAMLRDDLGMFGGPRCITHANDITGRINNINAIISLGEAIGCDMSTEKSRAKALAVPSAPNPK